MSVTTSISPVVAFGTSCWLSDGLRKSQSTRITRAPPWALSCAKDAAIVDLPSSGSDDVMPITLLDLAAPAEVGAHLNSAYRLGENGKRRINYVPKQTRVRCNNSRGTRNCSRLSAPGASLGV